MRYHFLITNQAQEWEEALSRFIRKDIYFLPEYHRMYELNQEGRAYAFFVEDGDDMLFYPFMLRPIKSIGGKQVSEECYDIQTVYGYSGPLSNTKDPRVLGRLWEPFREWCKEKKVVAEFIRFHPPLENGGRTQAIL